MAVPKGQKENRKETGIAAEEEGEKEREKEWNAGSVSSPRPSPLVSAFCFCPARRFLRAESRD